jgi:hypothetical protein
MICSVDLFPVPDSGGPWSGHSAPSNQIPYASSTPSSSLRSTYSPENWPSARPDQEQGGFLHSTSSNAPDVVWHHRGFPVTESSKLTSSLVGTTFVEPCLIDYQGNKALLFVFAVCNTLIFGPLGIVLPPLIDRLRILLLKWKAHLFFVFVSSTFYHRLVGIQTCMPSKRNAMEVNFVFIPRKIFLVYQHQQS